MKKGILLLIIATFLWAGNYICGRFLGPALPPILLNTIRWAISTIILICLLTLKKQRLPLFKNWKEFSLQDFLGVYAFSTLNYLGLQTISASRAGMISAGIPIMILLFTPFILKEKIKTKAWTGALVSIVGVMVLIQGKSSNLIESSIVGDVEILLSCVAWGLYTVFGKKYGKNIDPLVMTAGAAFYGTIFSAISCIGTVQINMIHLTNSAWICIIYVSTFASVIAYFAWNTGVKIVGAGRAAPYINLLPVWTVLLGILLLQEQISITTVIGGLITILGAILASL